MEPGGIAGDPGAQADQTEPGGVVGDPTAHADHGPSLGDSLRPRGPVHLDVSTYERGEVSVLALRGELDILTAPRFSASVDQLVRGGVGDVVVDLTEVGFVDSAGLQVLLSAQRRLGRRARCRAMICPQGPVRRVIELTRLIDTLGVVASFGDYDRIADDSEQAPAPDE